MTKSITTVLYHENVGHSPVWEYIPLAYEELHEQGLHVTPTVYPAWNDQALVAVEENYPNDPWGFMIYRYDHVKCSWFILLSYVRPEHRRKGIHTELFRGLVQRGVARDDILKIESGTHFHNGTAQAAFKAQGRVPVAIMYEYTLRDHLEGKELLHGIPQGQPPAPA